MHWGRDWEWRVDVPFTGWVKTLMILIAVFIGIPATAFCLFALFFISPTIGWIGLGLAGWAAVDVLEALL